MTDRIRRFLDELDAALVPLAGPGIKLDLYHIGRSALVFHFGAKEISTKDIDVVLMHGELEGLASQLCGRDTTTARRLGLYLDLVPMALPPLPRCFKQRCIQIEGGWAILRLWELDANDLVVTKLKSFRPQDRQDIKFLCAQGLIRAERLRESLEEAFSMTHPKDDEPDRDRAFAHLERVVDYLEGKTTGL